MNKRIKKKRLKNKSKNLLEKRNVIISNAILKKACWEMLPKCRYCINYGYIYKRNLLRATKLNLENTKKKYKEDPNEYLKNHFLRFGRNIKPKKEDEK